MATAELEHSSIAMVSFLLDLTAPFGTQMQGQSIIQNIIRACASSLADCPSCALLPQEQEATA